MNHNYTDENNFNNYNLYNVQFTNLIIDFNFEQSLYKINFNMLIIFCLTKLFSFSDHNLVFLVLFYWTFYETFINVYKPKKYLSNSYE